jgi:hypothetical protein
MGEIRWCCRKYLQIDRFRLWLTSSQILGYSGGFPGFRQRDRVAAQRRHRRWCEARRHLPVLPLSCRMSNSPAAEQASDHARRRPLSPAQPLDCLSPTSTRVGPRPVIRRRQPPIARSPLDHRREHALAGPVPLDRPGVAGLAVRVRVALAVARLGVGPTTAAHPDVARLDRTRLLPCRVVEVRLDRRRRATEPVGDLPDRETLDLAEVTRQGDRATALANPIHPRGRRLARHTGSRYFAQLAFSSRSASKCGRTAWTSDPRFRGRSGRASE